VASPLAPVKRVGRGLVRGVLSVPPIRRVVERELGVPRTSGSLPASPPLPAFRDRFRIEHPLDPGLRDKLKPNWRTMCDPALASAPPNDDALQARLRKASKSAAELERILALTTGGSLVGRILEVGCYDGSAAFELSRRPGTTVVASDMARYYVVQRPGQVEESAIASEEGNLHDLRERVRALAGRPEGSVTFVDLIVSFEVLEHLQRPNDAFAAMARLLKPGGLMYHDYNPFFSSIGGHSLVTLDLPWGHARLDPEDVERYLREIRPAEAEQALRFYRDSLNRMTLVDLDAAIAAADLEPITVIPWFQRSLVGDATPDVLAEVRRTYPPVSHADLLATFVAVVARRGH
jgi:SAM-dependent methyltransferase